MHLIILNTGDQLDFGPQRILISSQTDSEVWISKNFPSFYTQRKMGVGLASHIIYILEYQWIGISNRYIFQNISKHSMNNSGFKT